MIRILLLPFAILYDIITRFRNHLYNIGNRRSITFETNIISVGNLSVGGTGKTPMIEYLVRLLKNDYPLAILSRGYGRKTNGFILATDTSTATTIGDEPFQYYLKYKNEVTVAVGEERVLAIPTILHEKPETKIILLDDAYQHRSVKPLVNIMLTSYQAPFFNDYLLPSGRLREARKGANRADIIIVSKCPPTLTEQAQQEFKNYIYKYANINTPIFFSGIRYGTPIPIYTTDKTTENKKVLLLTGLANADLIKQHIHNNYILSDHIQYSDHYHYKEIDIKHITDCFNSKNNNNDHIIITTEKDYVKLINPAFQPILSTLPIFYIPIEVYFLKDNLIFDRLITEKGVRF